MFVVHFVYDCRLHQSVAFKLTSSIAKVGQLQNLRVVECRKVYNIDTTLMPVLVLFTSVPGHVSYIIQQHKCTMSRFVWPVTNKGNEYGMSKANVSSKESSTPLMMHKKEMPSTQVYEQEFEVQCMMQSIQLDKIHIKLIFGRHGHC